MLKELLLLAVTAIIVSLLSYFGNNIESTTEDSISTQMENTSMCGQDEISTDCIESGCQPITCSDLDRNIPCKEIDPQNCTKGCLCTDGYLRANNGSCVPISNCTLSCKKRNEVFVKCSQTCPPQTCESLNQTYFCPLILVVTNSTYCTPACRCKTGYYRNLINECISEDDCLKCTGPNEYYSTRGKRCYCERGYSRAKNNTCIPINSCTAGMTTDNQIGTTIEISLTGATTDNQITTTTEVSSTDNRVSTTTANPITITTDNGSCNGDFNATSGCGTNCGKICSQIGQKAIACPDDCEVGGCDCKDGYCLCSYTNNCVVPADCPQNST